MKEVILAKSAGFCFIDREISLLSRGVEEKIQSFQTRKSERSELFVFNDLKSQNILNKRPVYCFIEVDTDISPPGRYSLAVRRLKEDA